MAASESYAMTVGVPILPSSTSVATTVSDAASKPVKKPWLSFVNSKTMDNDNKLIVFAAGKAEAAVKYILNGKQDNN